MMFLGKPVDYWVELQAMAESKGLDNVVDHNIALLRVARAARYADDVLDRITQSFPDNEVPHPSIEECLNAYCDLHKALKELPDGLLEVVK